MPSVTIKGRWPGPAAVVALNQPWAAARRLRTPKCTLRRASSFRRSDFASQGYTGSYEAGQPTTGPLADAPILGAPSLTPKKLKKHLDKFVVGQDRAKKSMSCAVFNHYQRIQELRRSEEEEQQRLQQRLRRERQNVHPLEDTDEFPGQRHAIPLDAPTHSTHDPFNDDPPLQIDKSNILLLGPSGVGKTLMAKTLARVLAVPFSMSDCTPFTQAGYIGEDAEVCVERLLAAADYDVEAAEHGIICLDEVDKIAAHKPAHGRDVSGEGVQQALLKIIEGTTLHIQAKPEKSAAAKPLADNPHHSPDAAGVNGPTAKFTSTSTSSASSGPRGGSPPAKGETFSVRTENILFILTGAFIGLDKTILKRVAKGSMGFGSTLRSANSPTEDNASSANMSYVVASGSAESKHLSKFSNFFSSHDPTKPIMFNPLDLVQAEDLQQYGLIPELVGRVPVHVALSALDEEQLVRVLTEPRHALIRQYAKLFALSGIELKFTRGSLHVIARDSRGMGTGARGLRTTVERLLGEAMFEAPGSGIKYILITEAVARRDAPPEYFGRGQQLKFQERFDAEEEEWETRQVSAAQQKGSKSGDAGRARPQRAAPTESFEEYREKDRAAGVM